MSTKIEQSADQLTFRPVTTKNIDDFEALFKARGSPGYCWCMVWRGSPAEKKQKGGAAKHKQMRSRIDAGTPVGLLAYQLGVPKAWVSIAPKTTHIKLGGPETEPGETIWSLTCMFAQKALRNQGIAHKLIAAAVDHARNQGATIVEAYPVDAESPSYRFGGLVPAYERAGFGFIEMAGSRRHVMRLKV